jgi:hypothetical protein
MVLDRAQMAFEYKGQPKFSRDVENHGWEKAKGLGEKKNSEPLPFTFSPLAQAFFPTYREK